MQSIFPFNFQLPPNCTWQTLRDEFRSCGEVKFAEIRGQDCGVVRFAKERDAELAISKFVRINDEKADFNLFFLFKFSLQNSKMDHVLMVEKLKFHSSN